MKLIRIIHLSDFHLRKNTSNHKELIEAILVDLKNYVDDNTLLIFSGDFIDRGGISLEMDINPFDAFKERVIDKMYKQFPSLKNKTFFCPGNHDIDRSKITESCKIVKEALLSNCNCNKKELYEEYKKGLKGFEYYDEFQRKMFQEFNGKECNITSLDSNFIIQIEDIKIGISSLNSSVFCYEKDDEGKLFLIEQQLDNSSELIDECHLKIALLHHPLDFIHHTERRAVKDLLEQNYDLSFLGHIHKERVEYIQSLNGNCFFSIGTSLNGEKITSENNFNGYSVIEYLFEDKINVKLRLYNKQKKFVENNIEGGEYSVDIPKNKVSKEIEINSLKFFYFKNKKNLKDEYIISNLKITKDELLKLETFDISNFPFNNNCFPKGSYKLKSDLESILRGNENILKVNDDDSDFKGIYLSYYIKNKLEKNNISDYIRFKAIVFDFDGTLTKNDNNSTWEHIWLDLGYSKNDCDELAQRFFDNQITHQEWCNATCQKFRDKEMDENVLKKIANKMKLIDGTIPTLKKLRESNIQLYIVSGSIKDVIKKVLEEEGVALFSEIKSNEMIFNEKGMLQEIKGTEFDFKGKATYINNIVKATGIKPYEVLFIGNSDNDRFAHESGAVTLCVNPNKTTPTDNKKWCYYKSSMNNLEEILKFVGL